MTATVEQPELSRLIVAGAQCPVCRHHHCLTVDGRLWTHGPRRARCRGSRLRMEAARLAARTVRRRPIVDVHLPEEVSCPATT